MVEYNKNPEDAGLSSKVRIALKVNDATELYIKSVKVGTFKGTVHLMGEVPDEAAKRAIERVTRQCPDVYALVNEIEVKH